MWGNGDSLTPSIDKLARESVKFENVTSTSPWTLPSFSSILTGVYPEVHGASGSFTGSFGRIHNALATLPELLQARDYKTCAIMNGPFLSPVFGVARGFAVYDFFEGTNYNMRRAEEVVRKGESWLSTEIIQPETCRSFFLFLHFFDPHLNYDPPEDFLFEASASYQGRLKAPFDRLSELRTGRMQLDRADKSFIRSLYDGEVRYVDYQIGCFIRFLKEKGIFNNCLLIITSDHGEEFWEHGGFEHGHTLYEELVHVPLLIKLPGAAYGGTTIDESVSIVDIFPTVLEVAGCAIKKPSQARSLLSLLRGGPTGKTPAFSGSTLYNNGKRSVKIGSLKYILDVNSKENCLFDLETDPGEFINLSLEKPEMVRMFESELERIDLQNSMWIFKGSVHSNDRNSKDSVKVDGELLESLRSLGYVQ